MFSWISGQIEAWGVFGVAFLMFAENVFPPIPSELIMPLAGYNVSTGSMSLIPVLLAGIAGSLAGAVLWFLVGLYIGVDRLKGFARKRGRLLTVTPQEIDRADRWFDDHGGKAVFLGRLIPTVRTFISVPAGVSCMGWRRFLVYSTLGTAIWTAALTLAGYWLGEEWEAASTWLNPVSTGVVVLLVGYYIYRVLTFRRKVPREGGTRAG